MSVGQPNNSDAEKAGHDIGGTNISWALVSEHLKPLITLGRNSEKEYREE